jgi:hypothetical protein
MAYPVIETPRGKIFVTKNGKAELKFNTNFKQKWMTRYSSAQSFVDSEVLRLCQPLIPLRTSMLIKSGILGTDVGSGLVQWIAPYAKAQYFMRRKSGSNLEKQRGPFWFERMKATSGRELIAKARRIAGRGQA